MASRQNNNKSDSLRERLLDHFRVLRIPITNEQFDDVIARTERHQWSHVQCIDALLGGQANQRRERSIARRIREAHFRGEETLEGFDWKFNAKTIDRVQIEELATGDFIRRGDNLVMIGQSGLGKSHMIQGIGRRACAVGYRVRYATSAALLSDLMASLADQTLPARLRYYERFDLLIIDEFGFDRIERLQCPQAASLMFKIVDSRSRARATALITNVNCDAWADYLGDAPLASAFLDRLVDGAIIMRLKGKSFRASRAKTIPVKQAAD